MFVILWFWELFVFMFIFEVIFFLWFFCIDLLNFLVFEKFVDLLFENSEFFFYWYRLGIWMFECVKVGFGFIWFFIFDFICVFKCLLIVGLVVNWIGKRLLFDFVYMFVLV